MEFSTQIFFYFIIRKVRYFLFQFANFVILQAKFVEFRYFLLLMEVLLEVLLEKVSFYFRV